MNLINYTKNIYFIVFFFLIISIPKGINAQFISQQNGAWADGATWGNSSPGTVGIDYPGRMDDVIVRSGHQVTINSFNDNGGTMVSPEGLGLANVGDGQVNGVPTFPRGEDFAFYHIGNIIISLNAVMSINCAAMFEGRVVLQGQLNASADIIALGRFNITSHANLSIGGNYVVTANSVTDIDGTLSIVNDLYVDHTEALIGGSGSLNLTNSIQTFNPANNDISGQVCSNFSINCGNDCDPSFPGNQTNITGLSESAICLETLPIEFLNVNARLVNRYEIEITWATASEINNEYFEVERSLDGIKWEYVGMRKGAGTSTMTNYYVLSDQKVLNGNIYYRIKQIDYDGSFTYSNQVVLSIDAPENQLMLVPNPIQASKLLRILNAGVIERVEIFNQYGACVKTLTKPKNEIAMNFGIGIFNLKIRTNKETVNRQVVIN